MKRWALSICWFIVATASAQVADTLRLSPKAARELCRQGESRLIERGWSLESIDKLCHARHGNASTSRVSNARAPSDVAAAQERARQPIGLLENLANNPSYLNLGQAFDSNSAANSQEQSPSAPVPQSGAGTGAQKEPSVKPAPGSSDEEGDDEDQATAPHVKKGKASRKDRKDPEKAGERGSVAHISLVRRKTDVAMGAQYAAEIDKVVPFIDDPEITTYVNQIAKNLYLNSDAYFPDDPEQSSPVPRVKVVADDKVINAFALPGNFLYINAKVLEDADYEAQLAGVLAHELSHVVLRHWASNITKIRLVQLGMIPLSIMFPALPAVAQYGIYYGMNPAMAAVFSKFSKTFEAEADYYGLQYLYKAGYSTKEYVPFFQKILTKREKNGENQNSAIAEIFKSHPPTPERIEKANAEMRDWKPAPKAIYTTLSGTDESSPEEGGAGFDRIQALVFDKMAEFHRAQAQAKQKDRTKSVLSRPNDDGQDNSKKKKKDKKNKKKDSEKVPEDPNEHPDDDDN